MKCCGARYHYNCVQREVSKHLNSKKKTTPKCKSCQTEFTRTQMHDVLRGHSKALKKNTKRNSPFSCRFCVDGYYTKQAHASGTCEEHRSEGWKDGDKDHCPFITCKPKLVSLIDVPWEKSEKRYIGLKYCISCQRYMCFYCKQV